MIASMEKYCWDDPDENSPEPLRRPTNGKRASLIAEGPNEFTENGTISDFDVTGSAQKHSRSGFGDQWD